MSLVSPVSIPTGQHKDRNNYVGYPLLRPLVREEPLILQVGALLFRTGGKILHP